MIEQLKKELDAWLGDNGDDSHEIAFIRGFIEAQEESPLIFDYDAGRHAGIRYRDSLESGGVVVSTDVG